jgi:phage-related protein
LLLMDALLPPLILELRAKAGEAMAKMREVGDEAKKVEGETERSSSRASRSYNKMAGIGKASLLGLGGAAAVVGVESVRMASEFQKDTNVLVTAAGESASGLKVVRSGIQDIAMSTGTTWQNLTEGMYQVEKAGYRGADGLKVLRAAAQGAAEEGASMASVTNAMTSVMASYHLKASDSVRVMNALKTAAGEGKMTMEQFASSLSTVIPVASANKISFAEVGGAIATLTQHGTSAAEATQELSNTIRAMSAPNHVAITAMNQLGLSSTDLSKNMGKRGLTGTISMVVDAIGKHLGPSGLVAVDAFRKSQSASQDLQIELAHMPPSLRAMSKQLLAGAITHGQYAKSLKYVNLQQYQLGHSFLATTNQAMGFNSLLKSGSPAAATFSSYLKQIMGGATGMNTALMLSGENMGKFKERVHAVAKSYNHASKEVEGWKSTQNLFSIQMARLKQTFDVFMIRIGTVLIPLVQKTIGFFMKHTAVAKALGVVVGGFLVAAITAYIAKLATAAAKSVADFAKMIAKGAVWVAETAASIAETLALWAMYAVEWIAQQSAAVAESLALWTMYAGEWIATQARQFASSVAAGAVWLGEHAAMAAGYIAQNVAMAASATAAFIAENAATLGLVVAIAAVVAGVVWLATHWSEAWHAIKSALKAVWDSVLHPVFDAIGSVFKDTMTVVTGGLSALESGWGTVWGFVETVYRNVISPVFSFIAGAFSMITSAASSAYSFLVNDIINPIVGAFSTLWSAISQVASGVAGIFSHFWDGLLSAGAHVFNWVATAWNDTLGALHFTIPSWVPGLGGDGFGFPTIPLISGYASGGAVRDGLFMVGEHGPELGYKSGSQMRIFSNSATSGMLSHGGGSGSGSGGVAAGEVVELHAHLYMDGQQIQEHVERTTLQVGARRGGTYVPYVRGGGSGG